MYAFCLLWPKRKPKNAFVLWLSMVQQYKQSPLINIMYHLISTFVWIQIWLISKHDMYVYALYSWCCLLFYWQSTLSLKLSLLAETSTSFPSMISNGFGLCMGTLISVRSWNFKDGGSLKASFLAKNQHATKKKSLKKSYE